MKTSRSLFTTLFIQATVVLAGGILCASAFAGDDSATVVRLKESKHTLADGIKQAEKENGSAISAKLEVEDGKLWLSIYTAKAGRAKDAENNTLMELKGEANQSEWKPETEVFADKEHLTRSAMQLTLVQVGKHSLVDAIAAAQKAQPGTVYSVIPAVKDGKAVFVVKVATAAGKTVELAIDGGTGAVAK